MKIQRRLSFQYRVAFLNKSVQVCSFMTRAPKCTDRNKKIVVRNNYVRMYFGSHFNFLKNKKILI